MAGSRQAFTVSMGRFGVEVEGLDVGQPLGEAARAQLQSLFDTEGLLVFRDVDLSLDQQIELVGTIGRRAVTNRNGVLHMYVSNVEPEAVAPSGRLLFHSDLMWTTEPLTLLSLYGEAVEPGVAPTLFASTAAAYEDMRSELQAKVRSLRAVNVIDASRALDDDTVVHPKFANPRQAVHPVVYPHPRTGRPLLSVNEAQTLEIQGLESEDSESLIAEITSYIYDDRNIVEHEWQKGDLVVWDNLTLQHGRPNVEGNGPTRTLRRVTCGGLGERDMAGAVTYN